MHKNYLLLTAVFFFALTAHAEISGGELRYKHLGGTNYRVELDVYTQCTGLPMPSAFSTNVKSINCAFSQALTLSRTKIDTLWDMLCPTAVGLCTAGTPLYEVHHYSNTISLPCPATDWKFSYIVCCRLLGTQNIDVVSSSMTYLEAGLNNVTAHNSSAFIDNPPPFVSGSGAMISTPFHTTDPDGDSIVQFMITPQSSPTNNAIYNSGFSLTNPFGTGIPATISTSPDVMKTYANSGRFALAVRTVEYRNGVQVGYSSRDFDLRFGPIGNPKTPLPAATTSLDANICPGGTTTINLSFRDSVGTDSVYVDLLGQPALPGFTSSTVKMPGIGAGSLQYTLTAPTTLNAATNPYFIIPIVVRDNACPVRGFALYNVLLRVTPCVPDTVWPGDANGDKVVDLYDPLAISLAFGKSGPLRPAASISWTPQPCGNWSSSFLNSVNMKHADCNGDGTVNNTDLAAITANYGLTHPKEIYLPHAKVAGIPDLHFDHTGVHVFPGGTVKIPIKLGDAVSQFSNLYGLAAGLRITGITPGFGVNPVSYGTSWLGTAGNTVQFSKTTTTNNVDWAYARNNRQAVSGQGTLAEFSFTIPGSVTVGQKIVLTFNNVKMIGANGSELSGYNIISDTLTVTPSGVNSIAGPLNEAMVIPNPSEGPASLSLDLHEAADLRITLTDITGRVLWTNGARFSAGPAAIALPVENLAAGVYLISIRDSETQATKALKWVKE